MEVVITEAKPGAGFTVEGELAEDTRVYPSHTTVRVRCAACQVPVATKWKFVDFGDWGCECRVTWRGRSGCSHQRLRAHGPAPDAPAGEFPVTIFNTVEEDGLPAGFPKPARHSWCAGTPFWVGRKCWRSSTSLRLTA